MHKMVSQLQFAKAAASEMRYAKGGCRGMMALRRVLKFELLGVVLLGLGLCFAVASVGIGFSNEVILQDKERILRESHEMKSALIAAKVPEEQIPGLLRVHKDLLAGQTAQQDLMTTYSMALLGLIVACFGSSIVLFSRLKTSAQGAQV